MAGLETEFEKLHVDGPDVKTLLMSGTPKNKTKVLLFGEGNFSFSMALAILCGTHSDITSTCFGNTVIHSCQLFKKESRDRPHPLPTTTDPFL